MPDRLSNLSNVIQSMHSPRTVLPSAVGDQETVNTQLTTTITPQKNGSEVQYHDEGSDSTSSVNTAGSRLCFKRQVANDAILIKDDLLTLQDQASRHQLRRVGWS